MSIYFWKQFEITRISYKEIEINIGDRIFEEINLLKKSTQDKYIFLETIRDGHFPISIASFSGIV